MTSHKLAYLERLETGDQGTFGRIMFGNDTLYTGELPDRGNRPNRSCIPVGHYRAIWNYSPHFKREMYLIVPVDGRSGIRIHSANLMGDVDKGFRSQLYGCIALGERLGSLAGQKAVLVSRPAVDRFERWGARENFDLEIVNVDG